MEKLSTQIVDFLSLMYQCYEREQNEEKEACREIDEEYEAKEKCRKCKSAICKMVQNNNEGLECWTVYTQDPWAIYRFWYSGKVLPLIKKNE
jgi:hypothetical protein